MIFPSYRYHQTEEPRIITGAHEEADSWLDSPAAHGIETNPGRTPDAAIAANAAPPNETPRKHAKKARTT